MTPTVLTVNPGFGVLKKQADALLFSLYGEVKLLRGAVRLIDHILDNVDEHRMKPELLQLVAQIYPQDAAAKILDQMIATGILMEDGYRWVPRKPMHGRALRNGSVAWEAEGSRKPYSLWRSRCHLSAWAMMPERNLR